jgi:hypothetical protein
MIIVKNYWILMIKTIIKAKKNLQNNNKIELLK